MSPNDRVSVSAKSQYEVLRFIADVFANRNKRMADQVLAVIKTVPLPADARRKLVWMGPGEAEKVFKEHPGWDAEHKIESLWVTLAVFRCADEALAAELARFQAWVEKPEATVAHREERDAIQDKVRKEIFALSSAAFALVERTRRLRAAVPLTDFPKLLAAHFDQEEHEFVIQLRNNLTHVSLLKAGWVISKDFRANTTTSRFKFTLDDLALGEFNQEAQQFIQRHKRDVDVGRLFASYSKRVRAFYDALRVTIESSLPPSVRDYRDCVRERSAVATRQMLKAILPNAITRRVDPYIHLRNWLTSEQIEKVQQLPMRSKAQVDLIIALADENGACDDELRRTIYRLFQLSDQDAGRPL